MAFGLSFEAAGALIGFLFAGYVVAVLVGGPLADRVGRRPLLRAGLALNLLATAAVAVVPDVWTLRLVAFTLGAAGIGDLTATMLLAGEGGPRSARSRGFGHGAYAVGAVLVPIVAGVALDTGVDFRTLYLGAACVNLATLVLVWVADPAGPRRPPDRARVHTRGLARSRTMHLALAAVFLYVCAEAGVSIWLPTWARASLDASDGVAAAFVAALWAAMSTGRLALGAIPDHLDRAGLVKRLASFAAVAVAAALLAPSVPLAMLAVLAAGLGMSGILPVVQGQVAAAFPGASGTVLGAMGVATGLGGAVAPWLVGALAEAGHGTPGERLGHAMWVIPLFLLVFAAVGARLVRACAARVTSG